MVDHTHKAADVLAQAIVTKLLSAFNSLIPSVVYLLPQGRNRNIGKKIVVSVSTFCGLSSVDIIQESMSKQEILQQQFS